jgi:type II secretory pathway component PulJ
MKKKLNTTGNKGVTLIEMVIYMGILSIILIVFVDMFAVLVNKQMETESISSVQQDSNYILSRLSYDFSQAETVEIPAQAGSSSAMLRLMIASQLYDYSIVNNSLIVTSSGISTQLNGYDTTIDPITFTRIGEGNSNDVVRITIPIISRAKKQSGYELFTISTTLGIRAQE